MYWFNNTMGKNHLKDIFKKNTWYLDFYVRATDEGRHPESKYRGADKSLARPGRKQATATEDFECYIACSIFSFG
jgi:hypothetical protein